MEFHFNDERLNKAIKAFKESPDSSKYQQESTDRAARESLFQSLFGKPFDEAVLLEIIKKLWAAQIFGNKEYLLNKIVKDNGLQKLENHLALLAKKDILPAQRYDGFVSQIKGMGPSMVTEIMCYLDPHNCGVWNDRARKALGWLELKDIPIGKYKITGDEYNKLNQFLKLIAEKLDRSGFANIDLLTVDYFLWEVWLKFAKEAPLDTTKAKIPGQSKSRHEELISKLVAIGAWLGFEVDSEKPIAIGARVDVVWRARIANLGAVTYVFEVQDKGSVDSLILNLQKSQSNPTVQKLVIVSDGVQLEKIKKEIGTMPESFRKACAYWTDAEVDDTHQSLEQVSGSIAKLNLVNDLDLP